MLKSRNQRRAEDWINNMKKLKSKEVREVKKLVVSVGKIAKDEVVLILEGKRADGSVKYRHEAPMDEGSTLTIEAE